MAEEKFISKFDGTTENKLLDIINQNQGVFPFDSELNEQSQHGLTNAAIAKEINAIKDATSNNKGYFLTEEALKNAYPVANNGSKAYVGSNYPYKIYLHASGMWVDTGQTGGDEGFNAGEFYTKTQIDQKTEAINTEITRVEKGANYEVLEYEANIATTRLKVEEGNRKGGYMITYNPGTGWIKEQYIGELTDNEEWIKDENWKAEVLDENIQAIAENAQQQANLAANNAALAQEKANEASTQAAYAKEQGDLAAQRGGVGKVDPNSDGTGEIFNDYIHNVATGDYSHAEGYGTNASGMYSHAEGYMTTASGMYSHTEGYGTNASRNFTHAGGYGATASGMYSHAEGFLTTANSYVQTVIGYRNTPESNPSPTSYNATKAAFIIGNDGNAFKVLFNGQTFADGEYSSAGADYAEMFEWLDGNELSEDRVGRFVALKGNKIILASSNDKPIGVISAAPSIIGDAPMRWQGKFMNDQWGRPIYEDIEVRYTETISETDENGEVILKEVEKTRIDKVRKINPNYDPNQEYIPRENRKEWDAVGLLGKLLVEQDGTLIEGGYCKPITNGIATTAESGYYVMEIINESQALILFR